MTTTTGLLSEVGFAAIKAGNFDSAETIFDSLNVIESDNATGNIGLASIAMARGEMDKAVGLLEPSAFSDEKNAHQARKLLLLAAMMSGDKAKAGKVHARLVDDNVNPASDERKQEAENFFSVSN